MKWPESFTSAEQSHHHSLETLNCFYEHDDFMLSVASVLDLGCGSGLDLEWWATRTTREAKPQPLNIRCQGFDIIDTPSVVARHRNISYQVQDIEQEIKGIKKTFDVLWCHDVFQYVIDPFSTLARWYDLAEDDGMLVLIVPQTTNVEKNRQEFEQQNFCYHHWTLVNLIHTLAVSGWNCKLGHFRKQINDPWLHAVVYKSQHRPMDPRKTSWYDLVEKGLLPDSADTGINQHGYLRQKDLNLYWIDKSLQSFARY